MSHNWDEQTWKDLEAFKIAAALLPVGATEAHGPHLPLNTDSIISVEVARRSVAELKNHNVPALVLPCLDYAITDFSRDFPGTISIRKETFLALLDDIAQNLASQKIPLLCIVNSHLEPAHISAIREFAQSQQTVRVIFPDKTRKPWASLLTAEFKSGACHAGCYETSLVLSVREDLVREVRRSLPAYQANLAKLMQQGVSTFRDAGANEAYFGDPASATKEEGENTYKILTRMIVESILEEWKAIQAQQKT